MLLDWYYLNLKKSYRNFYEAVRNIKDDNKVDFRMAFHKPSEQPSDYKVELCKWHYGTSRSIILVLCTIELIILLSILILG